MGLFTKTYEVKLNEVGFLYRNHIFEKELSAGFHEIMDWKNRTRVYTIPNTTQFLNIINQEILTKDNISLRFSFNIFYKIIDGRKLLENTNLNENDILNHADNHLYNTAQIYFRKLISEIESEKLNEKRSEWADINPSEIQTQMEKYGIAIESIQVKDISFPKSIQDLFAKQLDAKIRAKTDLENARTAVATARALKNASEMMKDDENIKFFQMIETISKIAEKGKHTFMIGDINQLIKK
ncbi:MAG: slipin family protein [Bergeyella zoohelcum]|nr:slipin family protein [Bergeyella zoohelcum]